MPDGLKPFNEIAAQFDPMMPAEQYDAIRTKYFFDVVAPKVPRDKDVGATFSEFKRLTERPKILGPTGRLATYAKLFGTSAAEAALAPLKDISDTGKLVHSTVQQKQTQLARIADREGMATRLAVGAGSMAGAGVDFALLAAALGPFAEAASASAFRTAAAIRFSTAATRGGLTFAAYNVLADDSNHRLVEGLKGFAIGAGLDLAFSTPRFLVSRGLARDEAQANEILRGISNRHPAPPETDLAISEKLHSDLETARLEGRTKRPWVWSNRMPGARVVVTDVSGRQQPIEIRPYREYEAFQQAQSILKQGGGFEYFEVHPDSQKSLNEFLKIQQAQEEMKYHGKLIRTPAGQAEAVAQQAKSEGIPAEPTSSDGVVLSTIPVEEPILPKPSEVEAGPQVEDIMPTEATIISTLKGKGYSDRDVMFFQRQTERVWDPKIPRDDKRVSVIQLGRYAPELLPAEYRARFIKPEDVEDVRQADIARGGIASPAAQAEIRTPTGELKPGFQVIKPSALRALPQSETRIMRMVEGRVQVGDQSYPSIQRAINDTGESRFTQEPTGETDPVTAVREANLTGRLLGSVEDIKEEQAVPVARALATKGFRPVILKGYKTGRNEIVYFQRGDEPRVTPLITAYDDWVTQQAGRVFNSSNQRPAPVGVEMHRRLGRAFGVPEEEISRFVDALTRDDVMGGSKRAPELAIRPYGQRLQLQREDISAFAPGAGAFTTADTEKMLKAFGIELPPSASGATPLVVFEKNAPREIRWHERFHAGIMEAGAHDEFPRFIPKEHRQTALEIAQGLMTAFPSYEDLYNFRRGVIVNEAYVHASEAVRFNQQEFLAELARWDRGIDNVLNFVHDTSSGLLDHSFSHLDSVPVRTLQRTLWDLMRRTDQNVSLALRTGIRATSSGISVWYDPITDTWQVVRGLNAAQTFRNVNTLWDHLFANDKNFLAPSLSLRAERGGVRGPIVPPGSEPGGDPPPMPDFTPDGTALKFSAVSALWRPFLPWAATLHERLNNVFGRSRRYFPLYERVKAVDDQYRAGGLWTENNYTKTAEILRGFTPQKMADAFEFLTYPQPERTTNLMQKLKLTRDEALRAEQWYQWARDFQTDTGIGVLGYLHNVHPKLRGFGWAPEAVWGRGLNAKASDFWERAVRYDQTWEPQNADLGKFSAFLIRQGLEKKYTGQALDDLNKLINRKAADGRYLVPSAVRWPLTNYVNYMKSIPDQSQIVINNAMSNFLNSFNEKVKLLNRSLPESAQLPVMVGPPRQVLNRMMILSYAMGLGMRPAIAIRDMFQAFTGGMVIMGPVRFARAFARGLNGEAFDRAYNAGALLRTRNIGELYGDIMGELPVAGAGWFDRLTRWSNALLAPSRWGHNFGRSILFNGEYFDALENIAAYRAGQITVDDLIRNTSLWFADRPAVSQLLKLAQDREIPVEDAATKFALETVDLTQWPYRRGTQPTALRYGVGRIFGQYGVWPANYLDFLQRIGRKWGEYPDKAAQTTAAWVATNYALTHAMDLAGVDVSKWFWQSPAGFAGSPHYDFVHSLMVAPENTDEGRAARRKVLEYPLDFVPAMGEMRSVLRAMEEGDINEFPPSNTALIRILGFKPAQEVERDRTWVEWSAFQLGFGGRR